jgi:hypothetical protein
MRRGRGRRDDDEPAVTACAQPLPRVAGEEERTRQHHGEELIPAILVEVLDRGDVLQTSVRNHRAKPAEPLDGGIDSRPIARPCGEIGSEGDTRTGRIRGEVNGEDAPAVRDQPLGNRATDPARGARDERGPLHQLGSRGASG